MNRTSIEWTHRPQTGGPKGGFTWNPIRAQRSRQLADGADQKWGGSTGTFCTRISPGCKNCYASTINKRFGTGAEYTVPNLANHEFFIDPRILDEPVHRKKPATIFVGDMFDLFHEAIPSELIEEVFLAIVAAKQHTFQILTKRAERMQRWVSACMYRPHPHIWFGVSVENQACADERIPLLLETPAAVRFLSVEPLLEAVSLKALPSRYADDEHPMLVNRPLLRLDALRGLHYCGTGEFGPMGTKIDWVIAGGESGPGARPFNTAWAESILEQCEEANVPFFMKQLGSNVIQGGERRRKKDRKGGDWHEWPHELRVREFPA